MNYYDDFVRNKHREPTYEQLRDEYKRLQDQVAERQKEEREQAAWVRIQEKKWADEGDGAGEEEEPEEPQPIKTCRHIRENGAFCGSIAAKGRDYCPYHLRERGRRLKMARARARKQRLLLQLPPLEDLYAVQVGITQVLNALLGGQLDKGLGGTVLYGLQQAATNLCRPREVWEESNHFHSQQQMELPGFEAEFDLPKGFNLDTAPEVAFPEPATAEVGEERANLIEVTPLDMELMEIQQREGPEAVWRKLQQVQAAEDRRYRRTQAQLAQARYVVRAAAQNAAREGYFVARSQAAVAAVEAKEQAASDATGAPPASVVDRVGTEATRKEPQVASAEVDGEAKKLG